MARRKLTGEFTPRLITRASHSDRVVKSAQRVLEILEFFDDYRQEATVVQVAEALGYPQSSTSALLKSLATIGYLHHNPRSRTYISSPRVALLGSWLNGSFAREGALIQLMHDINESTTHAVVLIARNGLHAQYIHVVQAIDPEAPRVGIGHLRPLVASGAGYALLSTMSDKEVTRLVLRANAEAESGDQLVKLPELMQTLSEVRRVGYAVSLRPGVRCGVVAVPIPGMSRQAPLMLGVVGDSEKLRGRLVELGALLRDHLTRYVTRQSMAA